MSSSNFQVPRGGEENNRVVRAFCRCSKPCRRSSLNGRSDGEVGAVPAGMVCTHPAVTNLAFFLCVEKSKCPFHFSEKDLSSQEVATLTPLFHPEARCSAPPRLGTPGMERHSAVVPRTENATG